MTRAQGLAGLPILSGLSHLSAKTLAHKKDPHISVPSLLVPVLKDALSKDGHHLSGGLDLHLPPPQVP